MYLRGTVCDLASGHAIACACVTLQDALGMVLAEARTDEAGGFCFEGLGFGSYVVLVESCGYVSQTRKVDVVEGIDVGIFPLRRGDTSRSEPSA